MFNAALISGWHVHAMEYAEAFSKIPGCRVAAVYDDDAERGHYFSEKLNCPYFDSAEAALSVPGVTAGLLNSPTNEHLPLIELMARLGKHIFTEKVLTTTYAEAQKAQAAVEKAGVTFAISFPHLGRPEVRAARDILASGRLGQVSYARVRNAHNGASAGWLPPHFYDKQACGGGAMMDLGAHPMYTLAALLGRPQTAQSLFTRVTGKAVEDNAVTLLQFPGGAIGVSETGFLSSNNPYTLELSGTKGSLLLHESLRVCDEVTQGKWEEVRALPAALPSPLLMWARAVMGDGEVPDDLGMNAAVRLSALMDAAYRSYESGKAEAVPGAK